LKLTAIRSATFGALLAVGTLMFAGSVAARAEDGQPHPTESSTPAATAEYQGGYEDHDVQDQLEKKYGEKRDIATPPLLVKQAIGSGVSAGSIKTYVAQPLDVAKGQLNPDAKQDRATAPKPKAFNIAKNQPVIKSISSASFANPADEFAHWASVVMGLMAAATVAFFGIAFARRR
jgi:hypothetical protein